MAEDVDIFLWGVRNLGENLHDADFRDSWGMDAESVPTRKYL